MVRGTVASFLTQKGKCSVLATTSYLELIIIGVSMQRCAFRKRVLLQRKSGEVIGVENAGIDRLRWKD